MASIYKIINKLNGNCYVGSTAREIKHRKTVHFSNLRLGKHHSPHLQHAYDKYGSEFFELQIIEELSFPSAYPKDYIAEYLVNQEIYWINCLNPVYNVCREITPGTLGKRHTPEAIEKIRSRSQQEDNKRTIRKAQKIAVERRRGTHHSKESKMKMMSTKFGKIRKIQIYKDELLVTTCDLQKEASQVTGAKRSQVANVLCGLSKSANGFTLKYKEV